jgi:hypothetical protein
MYYLFSGAMSLEVNFDFNESARNGSHIFD